MHISVETCARLSSAVTQKIFVILKFHLKLNKTFLTADSVLIQGIEENKNEDLTA
jgi:hypothetical protein